jgi:hypothetical protein
VLHDNLLLSLVSVMVEPLGQHGKRSCGLVSLREIFHSRIEILWRLRPS